MDILQTHLWGIASLSFLIIASFWPLFTQSPEKLQPQKASQLAEQSEQSEQIVQPHKPTEITWNQRLVGGLSRSRTQFWHALQGVWGNRLNKDAQELVDELEAILYQADLGPTLTQNLLDQLKVLRQSDYSDMEHLKTFLLDYLTKEIRPIQDNNLSLHNNANGELQVIMVVGVNGAGKTTTIGKLATKLQLEGNKVVVGACDTFRAAAVDQLEVWCKRANVEMVRAADGADPSGVAYQTLEKAIKEKANFCILDTAGRLHNNKNLMEELKKGKRVLQKLIPNAPHHIYLVIDAITGQNAMKQAQEFHAALGLTGLIYTKCDGSAKGGSAISIVKELNVPISYIGVGESVDDLGVFVLEDYLLALVS